MKVEITQSNLRMSKKSLDIRSDMKKIHVTSVCGFKRIKIYSIKSDLHGTATCFKMLFQATLVRFQLSQRVALREWFVFSIFFVYPCPGTWRRKSVKPTLMWTSSFPLRLLKKVMEDLSLSSVTPKSEYIFFKPSRCADSIWEIRKQ